MKTPKELVGLIRESEIITNPGMDDRILHDARNELTKRRQDKVSPGGVLWRTLMKSKKTAFATASIIVIVALILIQFVGNPVGPNLTFAQVIEPILKAQTAAYDIVIGPDDGTKPVIHDLVMGTRIRRTITGGKDVVIIDLENMRVLFLNEADMEARYGEIDLKGAPSSQNYLKGLAFGRNYLEELKNTILRLKDMPDFTVEELGRKKLGSYEVVGFFASNPELNMTIWADVDTGLPLCIEYNLGTMQATHKNIKFNLPIDEEMFSMKVPAGYSVQEPLTMDLQAPEDNFIEGLRLIAEKLNYGRFPDDVYYESFYKWMTGGPINSQFNAMPSEEVMAISLKLAKFIRFIIFFPGEGEWTYRGKGVRLGETETPIFWYRSKGSETYHVIYGDLHVENIDPEDLPE